MFKTGEIALLTRVAGGVVRVSREPGTGVGLGCVPFGLCLFETGTPRVSGDPLYPEPCVNILPRDLLGST